MDDVLDGVNAQIQAYDAGARPEASDDPHEQHLGVGFENEVVLGLRAHEGLSSSSARTERNPPSRNRRRRTGRTAAAAAPPSRAAAADVGPGRHRIIFAAFVRAEKRIVRVSVTLVRQGFEACGAPINSEG